MLKKTHDQYEDNIKRWRTMRATIGGQDVIKGEKRVNGELYRPRDFLPDFVPANKERYQAYLQRALFTNFTGWTHNGIWGAVFRKPFPTLELPEAIEYVKDDIDGTGHGLEQFVKEVTSEVLGVARYGILVDYPEGEGKAYVAVYNAESILDWSWEQVDGISRVTMVKLEEPATINRDHKSQYRYLMLDKEGWYFQQVWGEDERPLTDPIYPSKNNGENWDYIPFQFFGSEDNRPDVDKPPLLDIAWINISHYQNSADLEENLHIHGQGTLFVTSSLSVDQWKEANPGGVTVGSRTGHFIGPDGNAILLQLSEASAISKAQKDKVEDMIGIGARFIQDKGSTQTAEAARIGEAQQNSGLATAVGNVQDGIINVLKWMAEFQGGDPEAVEFEMNRDFFDRTLTAQEISAHIMLQDSGLSSKTASRKVIRRAGWIPGDMTDEAIDKENGGRIDDTGRV